MARSRRVQVITLTDAHLYHVWAWLCLARNVNNRVGKMFDLSYAEQDFTIRFMTHPEATLIARLYAGTPVRGSHIKYITACVNSVWKPLKAIPLATYVHRP